MQTAATPSTRLVEFTGRKGKGVVAAETIEADTFIAEYVGEIISVEELERRIRFEYKNARHTYIMTYVNGMVIDATGKGNRARFINHSCNPNCETQKWVVCGETKVGIFSTRKVAAGEELVYDYRMDWNGGARVRCECGAPKCSGWLGGNAGSSAGRCGGPLAQYTDMSDSDNELYEDDDFGNLAKVQQFYSASVGPLFRSHCKVPTLNSSGSIQGKAAVPTLGEHVLESSREDSSVEEDAADDVQPASSYLASRIRGALEACDAGRGLYPSVFDDMRNEMDENDAAAACIEAQWTDTLASIVGAARALDRVQHRRFIIGSKSADAAR